jgi:histidinol-phosphate aminotransferase
LSHYRRDVFDIPLQRKPPREGLLNLSSNELIHPALNDLLAELSQRLTPASFQAYPLFHGVLHDFARFHGCHEDEVLISAGSDDGIKIVIEALAMTTGRMILQAPNYERWKEYAVLRRIEITEIGFGEDTPDAFSLDRFLSALAERPPSLVVLSNPNGPTGFCFDPPALLALSASCESHGHMLVIDACYQAFSGVDHAAVLGLRDHVVILHSFSKSFGLAGARVASILSGAKTIAYLARWNPQSPVSHTAVVMLRGMLERHAELSRIREDILASRAWFVQAIEAARPWRAIPSRANFVNVRTRSSEEAERLTASLLARKIRIRNTDLLQGLKHCARFTIAHRSTMDHVLDVIQQAT